MNREQFIQSLLEKARAAGMDQAEAYWQEVERFRVMVFEGEISDYSVNTTGGLSLRGLVKGRMGTAYTETLDEAALDMLVERVLESAALLEDEDEQEIFAGSPAYETVNSLGKDVAATAEEKIALALDLEKRALALDPRVNKINTGVQSSRHRVGIVNTHGLNLSHEADLVFGLVRAVIKDGERTTSGGKGYVARDLADLSVEKISGEAVEEALFYLTAKPCKSGTMPVIIRNETMCDLLETFAGVFSAESTQKDLSLLKGKVGQGIAAACVTLIDDPLRPEGMASAPFDDEGVATFRKNVIQDGKLMTLLHNLKTAKKDGVASTGNASKASYASTVGVSPSNFYFAPGADDLDTLCQKMGDGLVLTEVSGLHAGANAVSGDFSLLSKGYMVRGGKQAEPVEQITVAGNFYKLLEEVVAMGSDLLFPSGSTGSPSVWVKALAVAGS